MANATLSIVVPCYNEGAMVTEMAEAIKTIMEDAAVNYELLFVNDGSRDDTWQTVKEAAGKNPCVKGVSLSRNFGKESAMLAGLSHAIGDACAIIDCDLQHPPATLIEMFRVWQEGDVDIVVGKKESRGKEPLIYRFFAKIFYGLIKKIGAVDISDSSDFQLLDRRVADIITAMPERQRFFRALTTWVGFNKRQVSFVVEPRRKGVSKFNFYSSTRYALSNISSFSSAPMQLVTLMGSIFFFAALLLGIHTLWRWVVLRTVEGFTTVILLLLIIGAMLMISLGIIGFYIGKIYDELKVRPHYLVSELVNLK